MEATAPPLEDLRTRIDQIDDSIVDLLIARTDVVGAITEVKRDHANQRLAVRPAREAIILRRLAKLAKGRFPVPVMVRMWRELIAATTRMQTPFPVAVCAPDGGFGTWDLARNHFGSTTPMHRVASASQALRSVSDGSAAVAVLPLPREDDNWWLSLMSDQGDRVRIFGRLPFVASGAGADGDETSALALGRLELEPSGDDLAVLAIEAEAGVSRGRLRDLFTGVGLTASWLATWRADGPPQAVHLLEIDSFVSECDARIGDLLNTTRGEVLRIAPIGGYPRPLPAEAEPAA